MGLTNVLSRSKGGEYDMNQELKIDFEDEQHKVFRSKLRSPGKNNSLVTTIPRGVTSALGLSVGDEIVYDITVKYKKGTAVLNMEFVKQDEE